MKIDTHEKALVFWLSMVGIAFVSIVLGLGIGELITSLLEIT